LLAMSWGYTTTIISSVAGATESYTAGLIQQTAGSQSGSSITVKDIQSFVDAANRLLSRQYSVILLMKKITIADGSVSKPLVADLSRSIVEIG
jgi:hypothetical protein